tara:strand:+ start:978 stop:1193 length:216 start_codon:yes stop_codon:yes gene_type:complete
MQTQEIEITGVTYMVEYTQEYNSVEIYDIVEIDNPFLGTEDNPVYKEGELYGYMEEILINQYTDTFNLLYI